MKNILKAFLIGGLGLAVLIVFAVLQGAKGVQVSTDKDSYGIGGSLVVSIKNNSGTDVCFSSCYPYYMERKAGDWVDYDYADCAQKNTVSKCVDQNNLKQFRIMLTDSESGDHRLKSPACIGCRVGQDFRADKIYYSNPFLIQ